MNELYIARNIPWQFPYIHSMQSPKILTSPSAKNLEGTLWINGPEVSVTNLSSDSSSLADTKSPSSNISESKEI